MTGWCKTCFFYGFWSVSCSPSRATSPVRAEAHMETFLSPGGATSLQLGFGLGADITDGGKWPPDCLRVSVRVLTSGSLCLLWWARKQRTGEVAFMWGASVRPALQSDTHTLVSRPPRATGSLIRAVLEQRRRVRTVYELRWRMHWGTPCLSLRFDFRWEHDWSVQVLALYHLVDDILWMNPWFTTWIWIFSESPQANEMSKKDSESLCNDEFKILEKKVINSLSLQ